MNCQRKFSMKSCRTESVHKVAKTNATKTPLKPRLRISIFQLSPGNRLHRTEQSGGASSTKESHKLNERQSVKLKESVKKGKPESDWAQSEFTCSICNRQLTDSKELKLASTAINEHTNTRSFSVLRDEHSISTAVLI